MKMELDFGQLPEDVDVDFGRSRAPVRRFRFLQAVQNACLELPSPRHHLVDVDGRHFSVTDDEASSYQHAPPRVRP